MNVGLSRHNTTEGGRTCSWWSWTCQACCDRSKLGVSYKGKFCCDELSLGPHEYKEWGSGRLISSLKWTGTTWAGQGGSDSEGKNKPIFLPHKLTTETIRSLSGLFLSHHQTILLYVTYKLAFWLTDSENRMWESKGVIQALHKSLTDEALLSQIRFCRNLATEDWSGRGEAETTAHFYVGQ